MPNYLQAYKLIFPAANHHHSMVGYGPHAHAPAGTHTNKMSTETMPKMFGHLQHPFLQWWATREFQNKSRDVI
jgi:hypothetical protein